MRRIHSADACPAYAGGIFQQPLFQFHTKLVDFFRRGDGIVAIKAGQTKTIFPQTGGLDHAFHGQIVQRIQTDELGNGFFVFFFGGDQFSLGRKVNAIGTGMNCRWTTDDHMNFFHSDAAQILHTITAGGAADN